MYIEKVQMNKSISYSKERTRFNNSAGMEQEQFPTAELIMEVFSKEEDWG